MNRLKFGLSCLVIVLCFISLGQVNASSANISHSYATSDQLIEGNLVSLDAKRKDFVEPSSTSNGKRLIGVVVDSGDSLVAVDETAGKAQVATSGTTAALVSDLNGAVKVGDQISVSPFEGLGSRALHGEYVLGVAQSAFNSASAGAREISVRNKHGQTKRLSVGFVRVNLAITAPASGGTQPQNSLQTTVRSLTGHSVSATRIVLSMIIATVTLLAFMTLMYGAIYGGIISVGRNPLAKHAIFRSLGSVLLLAGGMLVVSAVLIYLLLH